MEELLTKSIPTDPFKQLQEAHLQIASQWHVVTWAFADWLSFRFGDAAGVRFALAGEDFGIAERIVFCIENVSTPSYIKELLPRVAAHTSGDLKAVWWHTAVIVCGLMGDRGTMVVDPTINGNTVLSHPNMSTNTLTILMNWFNADLAEALVHNEEDSHPDHIRVMKETDTSTILIAIPTPSQRYDVAFWNMNLKRFEPLPGKLESLKARYPNYPYDYEEKHREYFRSSAMMYHRGWSTERAIRMRNLLETPE